MILTIFESNNICVMELKAGYNPRRFTLTVVGSNFDRLFDSLYQAKLTDAPRNEHHIDYDFNLTTPYAIVHLGLFLSKLRTFESNINNAHFEEIAARIKSCLPEGTGRLNEVLQILSQSNHASEIAKLVPKRVSNAPHWVIDTRENKVHFFNTKDQPNIKEISLSLPNASRNGFNISIKAAESSHDGLLSRVAEHQFIQFHSWPFHKIYFNAPSKEILISRLETIKYIHRDVGLICNEIIRLMNTSAFNFRRLQAYGNSIQIPDFSSSFDNFYQTERRLRQRELREREVPEVLPVPFSSSQSLSVSGNALIVGERPRRNIVRIESEEIESQPQEFSRPVSLSVPTTSSLNRGANALALEGMEIEVPEELRCPLSLEIMTKPTYVEGLDTKQCFEFDFIKRVLDTGGVHPTTRESLIDKKLVVNGDLEKKCADFVANAIAPKSEIIEISTQVNNVVPEVPPAILPLNTFIEVKKKRGCCTIN